MTVVYVAPTKSIAESIRRAFEAEGIMTVLKESKRKSARTNIEILVLESELEEAQAILFHALQR